MIFNIWLRFRDWLRFLWNGNPQKTYEKIVSRIFRPVTGAAVITLKEGKMLAVRKNNFYMLPGGSLEPGETLEEAAAREAKEETGFDVEIEKYLGSVRQKGRGPIALFKAEISGGEKEGSREGEPEFLEMDRVPDVDWRFNRDMEPVLEMIESEFNS